MKKAGRIIQILSGSLCLLFTLAAAGIESWLLLSGDWRLYENQLPALLQTCAKLLLALYCLRICLRALRQKERPFLWDGLKLLAAALAAAPFLSNQLGWVFAATVLLFVLLRAFPELAQLSK